MIVRHLPTVGGGYISECTYVHERQQMGARLVGYQTPDTAEAVLRDMRRRAAAASGQGGPLLLR